MLEYELINLGTMPNSGDGDPVKTAFTKVNNNFTSIVTFLTEYGNLPENFPISLVNTGILPNDNTGDTFTTAFNKINNNFTILIPSINSFALNPININLVQINENGTSDTLFSAFTKVNSNFTVFLEVLLQHFMPLADNTEPQIEVSQAMEPMLFSSPTIIPLTVGSPTSQEIINIGALPNDGTGDPLRTAFGKINNNFSTLWNTSTGVSSSTTLGNSPGQVIFESEIANYSSATFVVKTKDDGANSQNINLSAQISNDNNSVTFTAYATTFIGDPLCRFDMDVDGANLRILCDPLTINNLTHTVFSQLLVET